VIGRDILAWESVFFKGGKNATPGVSLVVRWRYIGTR
jgi:hypothetical protein